MILNGALTRVLRIGACFPHSKVGEQARLATQAQRWQTENKSTSTKNYYLIRLSLGGGMLLLAFQRLFGSEGRDLVCRVKMKTFFGHSPLLSPISWFLGCWAWDVSITFLCPFSHTLNYLFSHCVYNFSAFLLNS